MNVKLVLSKSVREEEWLAVYREALKLSRIYPCAEIRELIIGGQKVLCLARSRERQIECDGAGSGEDPAVYRWIVDADYNEMTRCAPCSLSADAITKDMYEPDAGDAILGILPDYLEGHRDDPVCSHTICLFGDEVRLGNMHYAMLAIACLIVDRLGKKAYMNGDFGDVQCGIAVRLVNHYLDRPIGLPDQLDVQKLYERIRALPLTEEEQQELFLCTYRGEADEKLNIFMKEQFGETVPANESQERGEAAEPLKTQASGNIYGYDITSVHALRYYQAGDRIAPDILSRTLRVFGIMGVMQEDYEYRMLMRHGTAEDCFAYLAQYSWRLLLRDEDWENIWKALQKNKASFLRYYPLAKIRWSPDTVQIVRAIILNDSLYTLCEGRRARCIKANG